uniref:Protein kinase domain-containing protein n=1 Tax=Rhizophagus irregularis (strain DAOM 181602 / DAOM 197198 / MUCL 43194) TaxID=747089 RepID=U9U0N3_RHIID
MELDFADCWDFASGKEIIVKNFTNWTSGNEIIDNFIQEKQLKYDGSGRVFEWIPYNELLDIKEIGDNCLNIAIFKNGPLWYDEDEKEWIRSMCEKVCLRYLHNPQDLTDEFINKIESYSLYETEYSTEHCYGITQNPDTRDYILTFSKNYLEYFCEKCGNKYENTIRLKWCKCQIKHIENNFTNWTSGNKIIDNFIKEKQLKFNGRGTVFEWIPYNELIDINVIEKSVFVTAIRKDGQLYYDFGKKEWTRKLNKKVILRFLYDLQNINEYEFLNKVEPYLLDNEYLNGISQNPDTNVYILVFSEDFFEYYCENCGEKYRRICNQCQFKNNFTNWSSGNKIIDNFIQEKQLKYNGYGSVFEWIPFNELIIIKEIEDSCSTTAILKNGLLCYSLYYSENRLIRKPCEKVCLKYLHNLHDITDEFLIEITKSYLTDDCYGFSQNPDTKEYILVFSYYHFDNYCIKCGNEYVKDEYSDKYIKWCKQCQINQLKSNFTNWTSGNKKIDEFIQKSQSRISEYSDTVFEWIPYNKFININEIGKSGFTIAIWKDGPLYYSSSNGNYKRKLNRKVLLKHWYNLQNINVFFNEIIHLINESYGISRIQNTNDFILVLQPKYYCENCWGKYNNKFEIDNKSCISCQTNHENKKIGDLIQEMKLNINQNFGNSDKIFEWIPYDQFSNIEEIGKGGFSTVYSAIWKDGLLLYKYSSQSWKRIPNRKVALKCLHNSQNSLDEFINKIKVYPRQMMDYIINLYGISQDPNTKDYIMVLEYAKGGNFNNYLDKNYESFDWLNGLKVLTNIIGNLSKIHQEQMKN